MKKRKYKLTLDEDYKSKERFLKYQKINKVSGPINLVRLEGKIDGKKSSSCAFRCSHKNK